MCGCPVKYFSCHPDFLKQEYFSFQSDHIFKQNFQSNLQLYLDTEATSHFLLHCHIFHDERYNLLSTLNKIDCKLLELTYSSLSQTVLYGNIFDKEKKKIFLIVTTEYILSLKDSKSLLFSNFFSCNHGIRPKLFLNNLL